MTSNREDSTGPVSRFPLEGFRASWMSVAATDEEKLSIGLENEAWTVQGIVSGIDVHYAIRLSAMWRVQQMLLFRDLDEPDLWLANDGSGRWGEVNGSHRRELGGCEDVDVRCSAFTRFLAIRRLDLAVGSSGVAHTVVVDPDTLALSRAQVTFVRQAARSWSVLRDDGGAEHHIDVDEYGLPLDVPGHFVRTS